MHLGKSEIFRFRILQYHWVKNKIMNSFFFSSFNNKNEEYLRFLVFSSSIINAAVVFNNIAAMELYGVREHFRKEKKEKGNF